MCNLDLYGLFDREFKVLSFFFFFLLVNHHNHFPSTKILYTSRCTSYLHLDCNIHHFCNYSWCSLIPLSREKLYLVSPSISPIYLANIQVKTHHGKVANTLVHLTHQGKVSWISYIASCQFYFKFCPDVACESSSSYSTGKFLQLDINSES